MYKNLLLLLISILTYSSVIAQVTVSGRNILVDGNIYQIKGICYSPVAIGSTWTPDYSKVDQDITLMKEACINTIRTYSPINDKNVLDKFANAGIKVIIGFTLEETQNGWYSSYINTYKNHPAILMWVHGNEFNYHPDWFGNNLNNWYTLLNNAAAATKTLDANHPVATVHGELPTTDAINACPNVQVWGMNIYRRDNLGTLFTDWAARSGKPMFLGETGGDSYPDVNAPATAIPKIWSSVDNNGTLKTNGVCSGACFFEWSDEWWKAGNPWTQETGGFSNGGVPYDGFANEEYWGVVDINRNKKPGYNALKTSFCTTDNVTQSPYGGTPWNIPGKIEVEDYDIGGQDIAYYDGTEANEGGAYRSDRVDIEESVDGGYNVGWTNPGEWLEYTVNVATTGKYDFKFRISSPFTGKAIRVEMDGTPLTTVTMPNTGGYQTWQTVTVNNISLNAGKQILRLFWVNEGINMKYFEVTAVPTSPPTISITSPANNASFKEGTNVTINANASDSDGSVTKVEFYNGDQKLGEDLSSTYSHTLTGLAPGTYTVTAKAIDNNNASATASVTFSIVANVNPTISITSPANNASFKEGTNVTINANASDSDGSVTKVEFYNGDQKLGEDLSSTYSHTLTGLAPGTYTITAKAIDNNNASATASVTFSIVANVIPTISITSPANNASFKEGTNVTINVNASDSDGAVTKVEFYNGDQKLGEDLSSTYSHTLTGLAPGTYTITAKAIDNNNASATASATFSIVANVNPTISITSPANNASFKEGTNVTINVNASDSDGAVTKVEFYNGDQLLSYNTSDPYTYTLSDLTSGTYTITCKAIDNDNASASTSISFTITPTITSVDWYTEINEDLIVYPIPATSELTITIPQKVNGGKIVIYDMLSTPLESFMLNSTNTPTITIQTGNYTQGLYFVALETPLGKKIKRITIVK